MTYKILSVSRIDDTIKTTVEFQLNTQMMLVDVDHFRPVSTEEIDQNIRNRAMSEQSKIDSITGVMTLLPTITIGETIIF
jgi:hypothetical protein